MGRTAASNSVPSGSNGLPDGAAAFTSAPVPMAVVRIGSSGCELVATNNLMDALHPHGVDPGPDGEPERLLTSTGPVALTCSDMPTAGGEFRCVVPRAELCSDRPARTPDAARWLWDIVDSSSALVYVKDLDGRYLLVNRQFERRFGLKRDDVIGRTDFDVFPRAAAQAYAEHDREAIALRGAIEVEEPAIESTGTQTESELPVSDGSWLSIKVALLDDDGAPYGIGGISTDISDAKRAEAAERAARAEAERANRAKSDFLSRMSHELRTPLNAILGFGQLLALEPATASAEVSVERILAAGGHLLTLINEVLEITRIEAGAQHIAADPVPACEPLQEAIDLLRPLAHERGLELSCDYHKGLHQYVLADRQRLKQVLLNLITNAIKYNNPDGVVRIRFAEAENDRLRYLITDTGPGLDPVDARRMFEPFERLSADATDTEGTGLGLALSKSLIEAMGGTIGIAHTALGEGTTFFAELRMTGRPESSATPTRTAGVPSALWDLGAAEILYVEDNLSNLELVQGILSRASGVNLIPAMQGQLALELAAQHQPNVILLDLDLPDISGEEVLSRLRGDGRTDQIPVVVLSADATPDAISDLKRQGISAYVTKPIDIAGFLRTLRAALGLPAVDSG